MLEFLFRRFILLGFMLLILSIFAFSLSYLFPGNLLSNLSGIQTGSFQEIRQLELEYKINENIVMQYFAFIERLFHGDLGLSFSSGQPVSEHIVQFFPATFELALYALVVAIAIGIPTGILSAAYYKKWPGAVMNTVTVIGYSTPVYWLALVFIMAMSLQLGLLPMSGRLSLLYEIPRQTGVLLVDILLSDTEYKLAAFLDALKHLTLPTLALASYPMTVLIRFTRESMLHVMEQPFIKTARAKGLSRGQLIYHHAIRNALLPVIRQIGLQFSTLITLAMITEVIFSWPGIGRWLIDSIYQRDFPAIQGGLMVVASFVILATILADFLHMLFNPLSRERNLGTH